VDGEIPSTVHNRCFDTEAKLSTNWGTAVVGRPNDPKVAFPHMRNCLRMDTTKKLRNILGWDSLSTVLNCNAIRFLKTRVDRMKFQSLVKPVMSYKPSVPSSLLGLRHVIFTVISFVMDVWTASKAFSSN
jgi:hypothetical protein